jgi:hypothetical protein
MGMVGMAGGMPGAGASSPAPSAAPTAAAAPSGKVPASPVLPAVSLWPLPDLPGVSPDFAARAKSRYTEAEDDGKSLFRESVYSAPSSCPHARVPAAC